MFALCLLLATYKQTDYEALRHRCVELKQAGWKQADIARAFGLTPAWVSQTLKTFRQHGHSGLITVKRTRASPRLTLAQLDQLTTELAKGAQHHGFSGQVWTRPRVNQVIDKLFGVSYDRSTAQKSGLEPSETRPASPAIRLTSGCQLARRTLAHSQKKPKMKGGHFYMWMNPPVICCLLWPTVGPLGAQPPYWSSRLDELI